MAKRILVVCGCLVLFLLLAAANSVSARGEDEKMEAPVFTAYAKETLMVQREISRKQDLILKELQEIRRQLEAIAAAKSM